ncbi:MAG: 16S rRNA (adenine(1518)-N(6)/adenine(1519)-N(6))-dimethyltransferase RsmA [Pseudomonadales bacterium]
MKGRKGVFARKRFGQHFLTDDGVLERMVRSIAPAADDLLLEIGPGHGALTEYLYGTTARYAAIEIDRDLVPMLRARFEHLELVSGDVLRVDLNTVFGAGDERWRVAGNLPYNISTPLLVKLLDHLPRIRDMHFMLQREVAQRLAAGPGSKAWGRITVLVQYHCEVASLFEVAPESFEPPPRVWSAVVRLTPRSERLPVADPDSFDRVLRYAFAQRRKRLSNALQSLSPDWARAGVDPGRRADDLSVAEFVALANTLSHDRGP